MRERRLEELGVAVVACAQLVGCSGGPTRPSTTDRPPPIVSPAPASDLVGLYSLTLTVADQCIGIPDAFMRRTYEVTVEPTAYNYLSLVVRGDGFSDRIPIGVLWDAPDGRITVNWNNFDFGSCDDVYIEPLSNGPQLVVCGSGEGMRDVSTISGTLNGSVWIQDGAGRGVICKAAHQFRLTRTSGMVASR